MAINLFEHLAEDAALHPQYLKTRDHAMMSPARSMLRKTAATMVDPDGNFVQQFQTHGFDARTFELYLNALFTEAGHTLDRSHSRPDFLISRDGITAAVEAVTANPPPQKNYQPYVLVPEKPPSTQEEAMRYLKHEVAIKFGSPLYSKMQKKYWTLPHVMGKPLVIAIETFHGGGLHLSSTSISQYLFGIDHQHWFGNDGNLVVEGKAIINHEGSKTIPSNFFGLPDAKNISGILFSNAGTIPKFGRIGQQAHYRSSGVRMVRAGTCWDHNPNAVSPQVFAYEVGDPGIPAELWRDGSVFIHNPDALHPLPSGWLGAGAEESLGESGTVIPTFPDPFHVYASTTFLLPGDVSDEELEIFTEKQVEILHMSQTLGEQWRS